MSADWSQDAVASRLPSDAEEKPVSREVERDGAAWPLGTSTDIAWIAAGVSVGRTITSAIPAVFQAYATVVLPPERVDRDRHDEAIMSVLRAHSTDQRWWLGYLDTGADDIVFPNASRVDLYSNWSYVLVQAGPEQAATWRRCEPGAFWPGHLPNLMFPADRSWLASTLWDDGWTCLGGSTALVQSLLQHPDLSARARQAWPGQDATPPGHQAF